MSVVIYTDGSAKGNPGRGGYGVVYVSWKTQKRTFLEGLANHKQQDGATSCNYWLRIIKTRINEDVTVVF